MKRLIVKIWEWCLDLLFPIECLSCGKEDSWVCESCWQQIRLCKSYCCPICKKGITGGQVCLKCQSKSFLNGVLVSAEYDDKIIHNLTHYLKYKNIKELAKPIAKILATTMQKIGFWDQDWVVMPVPLHKYRQRLRGFNQSELIAREIADKFNLSLDINSLKRTRYTYPQMKLSRLDRLVNVQEAFSASCDCKKVILIDDVMTTGSTLQECAKALKKSGVKEVWAVVLARGV